MLTRNSLTSICKKDIIDIYSYGVNSVKPEKLIRNVLDIKDDKLTISSRISSQPPAIVDLKSSNVHILGLGKSALSMVGAVARIAFESGSMNSFRQGYVIAPVSLQSRFLQDKGLRDLLQVLDIKCTFGALDNLPDESSVEASKQLLTYIDKIREEDRSCKLDSFYLVLIGGGGSACLSYPRYISLSEKLSMINFLQKKGADIVELNKVRRFFSYVKGGRLANHILSQDHNTRIHSLILSDVVNNPIEFIASGPTFIEALRKPQSQDMLEVLDRYQHPDVVTLSRFCNEEQSAVALSSGETKSRLHNDIIGDNSVAVLAAKRRAETLGYQVKIQGHNLEGRSIDIVNKLCEPALEAQSNLKMDKLLVLAGGEATVSKTDDEKWGKGGRAQEMALDYLLSRLQSKYPTFDSNIDLFLAGSTDGQDGPTDVAACLASYADLSVEASDLASTMLLSEALEAKSSHDSFNFWHRTRPDWLIKTGMTETNVMDLYMFMLHKK